MSKKQLFGKTEQVKIELVGKIDRLTEQECRELMALLQLTIDGIEELEKRFDIVSFGDKL